MPAPDELLAERVAAFRAWCRDNGAGLMPGDEVREDVAARLLGRSAETLRGYRNTDRRIPFRKSGGSPRYRLVDLAAFDISRGD